jgi:hypothetical protein
MATEYPECEKMKAVHEKSQAVGEFLEWLLDGKGFNLTQIHRHTDDCYDNDGEKTCDMIDGQYYPAQYHIENLLAEYYDIDLKKVDAEKDQMLKEFRKNQQKK